MRLGALHQKAIHKHCLNQAKWKSLKFNGFISNYFIIKGLNAHRFKANQIKKCLSY